MQVPTARSVISDWPDLSRPITAVLGQRWHKEWESLTRLDCKPQLYFALKAHPQCREWAISQWPGKGKPRYERWGDDHGRYVDFCKGGGGKAASAPVAWKGGGGKAEGKAAA